MNPSSAPTFYAVLYAELRQAAFHCGYALALHGSLQKDLDVLAVPWTQEATDEATLVEAVRKAAGGCLDSSGAGQKPHGRRAYTIHLLGCSASIDPVHRATYIDLSVMPRNLCQQ